MKAGNISIAVGIYAVIVISSILVSLQSCQHDPIIPDDLIIDTTTVDTTVIIVNTDPCDPDSVYFENTILPLISSNCAISGCHDPGTAEDGVILNNYINIITTGDVDPGDPGNSEMFEVLVETDPDKIMPPPGSGISLTSEQIQLIFNWISQGALENGCTDDCDTTSVSFADNILPLINGNCTGCHSGTSPQGGILLTNYSNISMEALSGDLLASLTGDGVTAMPFNLDPLAACQIDMVRIWIEDGAPDN